MVLNKSTWTKYEGVSEISGKGGGDPDCVIHKI